MKVNEMITLPTGESYGLLLKSYLNDEEYFLAVLLNENEEPVPEYKVFKEIKNNNQSYVLEESNPLIVKNLLDDYRLQVEEMDEE